jgi:type III secretion system FlhB-like substrate exporter
LGATIQDRLADLGEIEVHIVEDPVQLGALGALRLGQEVPEEYWKNLTIADL